ncbi:hypothetical protein OG439_24600 [Amycolatopsis sp. NBC_01307]|uniref:hypothetical protein n=1 Tax=Amycolatopsis sp. NBC_01307 TaxID=2903561 RepID=UPI002E15F66A|nr:hypothetical protein OG439_24600 [Amycolatopsis sp. NBC_01307]
MGNRIAAASLVFGIISAVIGYLSLAHDSNAWPYTGPPWLWIGLGATMTISAFLWIVILKVKNSPLPLWILSTSFTVALVGAVVATSAALSLPTPDPDSPAAITIDSHRDGTLVENPVVLSGGITHPLAVDETLWLVIANVPPQGGSPGPYLLQPGPCQIARDGKAWSCAEVRLVDNERKGVVFYMLGVHGDQARIFGQRLIASAQLDQRNVIASKYKDKNLDISTTGPDPRSTPTLPGGEDIDQLASVKVVLVGK